MFSTEAFGQAVDAKKTYRVWIQGPSAKKAQLQSENDVRWDFKEDGFTTTVNEKQYQALQKNKNIKMELVPEAKVSAKPQAKASASPSDQTPWGIEAIYNDPYIRSTSGGSGIRVAVLDTGVNINHSDLSANAEQCKDFTYNTIRSSCADRNGHGTHVAGTVLANGGWTGTGIYGVAPQSKLWAYKVLSDSGSGYLDDIAAAIRHAADEGVRTNTKVIISMSLGSSSDSTLIRNAVDYAYNKGALVVAAAGNSGPGNNTIDYPGAYSKAIAVAALENRQENGTYRVANFSSRGNQATAGDYIIQDRDVEVSAPGAAIESTWSNGGYNTISGTSMATPHVSGLAAKIWASNPTWSNTRLRTELQNKAKQYDIKGGYGATTGDDHASGFGFPRVR
ncbi:S8 family serine peptidase [Bacillus aquiflavi]|nr:S8 family serine peptidase [Bacillus aquiflavi]